MNANPLDVTQSFFWMQIATALLCSFVIGLERQLRFKPMGIRTCALVCLGTMMFINLSAIVVPGSVTGDPSRVLGQVVTGIGFLGAGLIMNKGGSPRGITSAAVVWVLAALGCVIGFGFFRAAIVLTFLTLIILTGIIQIEFWVYSLRKRIYKNPNLKYDNPDDTEDHDG